MKSPFISFYLKSSDWLTDQGVDKTLALCKRAQAAGFNAVLLWDNMAQRPQPQADYPESVAFRKGLADLGMAYAVQVASLSDMAADALGDRSILESNGDGDPECCLADPRVHDLWKEQAKRVLDWWPEAEFLMLSYDEIRRGGTHAACRPWVGRYGDLLAAHAKEAIGYHREITGKPVAVWSDMFDPFENAAPGDYHGVKGGFGGSWKALDAEVLVVNWNTNASDGVIDGFKHFAGLGCRQLYAGFYDPGEGDDGLPPDQEKALMAKCIEAAGDPGIFGYCYTTWVGDYKQFGRYYPGSDLLERMKPLGAAPTPAPVPAPVITPSPDSTSTTTLPPPANGSAPLPPIIPPPPAAPDLSPLLSRLDAIEQQLARPIVDLAKLRDALARADLAGAALRQAVEEAKELLPAT